jgi:dephospho-CoA kinase
MQILDIVGGVASGKTLVSSILEEFGAVVLSGDQIAHQVLREPEIVRAIQERWGEDAAADP